MSNWKKTKKEAWEYYKKWMKEKTFCPLLNEDVRISRQGWDHLVNGGSKTKRSIKDKHLRMRLLIPAKYVIKNATKSSITTKNGVHYLALEGKTDKGKFQDTVKVILKRDKKGNLIFYSVMKK